MKHENETEIIDSTSESEHQESDSDDSGSDTSESSGTDSNFTPKVSYHLSHEKAVSVHKHYICHMCGST